MTGVAGLQGHVVATSPAYSHRLPHVFSRPDEFDPERFAAPREEDKAAPFSFIGFGGGRHGCMGSNFAILQVRCLGSETSHYFHFRAVMIATVRAHGARQTLGTAMAGVHP